LKVAERLALVDRIGRELQNRYSYGEIDNYLAAFGVQPHQHTINSKWVYVKEALAGVDLSVVLQIPHDVDMDDATARTPPAADLFEAALVRFLFLRDVKESGIGGQAKSNSHGRVRYAEAFGHSRRAVHAFGFEFGDQMGRHQQICGKAVGFGFLLRTNPVVRRSRPHGAVSQGIADTKLEQVAVI